MARYVLYSRENPGDKPVSRYFADTGDEKQQALAEARELDSNGYWCVIVTDRNSGEQVFSNIPAKWYKGVKW